jgi:hypothetical protein
MGKTVRCPECGERYRTLERLEDLRDNDSVCLVCNAPIEVVDWDRVLASYEDEDDLDDVDDLEEVEDEEDADEDEEWSAGDDDDAEVESFDDDEDLGDEDESEDDDGDSDDDEDEEID